MGQRLKTIAIYTANDALGAVLSMILADHKDWRVRVFDSEWALRTYAGIALVDIVICDTELGGDIAPSALMESLKLLPNDPDLIVLTRELRDPGRIASQNAGVDEILIKPMSPVALEERVEQRLADRESNIVRLDRSQIEGFSNAQDAPSIPPHMLSDKIVSLSDWRNNRPDPDRSR